jgi:hypothetical protein
MFLVSITAVFLFGCVFILHDQTISDGEIEGIGGYDLHGTVDCEPNEGPVGTPASITVVFNCGANLVCEIHTLQATGEFSYEFVRTPKVDPV